MLAFVSTTLPMVGVSPTKYIGGVNTPNDAAAPLQIMSFSEAFEATHPTDSHFVTYTVAPFEPYPRINKASLSLVRAAGVEVLATMIVLDYDNPQHRPWLAGEWDAFLATLANAADSVAMQWTLLYGTRGGARLVYVLDSPCPVDLVEGYHAAIVGKLTACGFGPGAWDTKVKDWSRFFRLPWVVREEKPTGDPSQWVEQPDNRLLLSTITPAATQRSSAVSSYPLESVTDPKPTPEQARALLSTLNASGKPTTTQFYRAARKMLSGRSCYPCVFENAPLADKGARGSTMLAYVGQAVSMCYHIEGVSPAHIYSLFFPAAEALAPADDVADWTDLLWRMTCRNWGLEASKEGPSGPKEIDPNHPPAPEPVRGIPEDMSTRIINGMREWCKRPELDDIQKQGDFINRHLLVSHASVVYLMGLNGRYECSPLQQFQIIPAVRCWALGALIDTLKVNSDGVYVDRKPSEVINQYATIVQETHAVPEIDGSYVDNIDLNHARLVIPSYSRNKNLVPMYDAQVEEWLYTLTGKDFDSVCKWIAGALAFDEGAICAISLIGPRGAGKKLFIKGLSECLTAPRLASGEDIAGNYTYGLLNSPFLVINEGWPGWKGAGKHPADQFRSLVAGDPLMIQRKYLAPVSVSNPVRVIFTANNLEVVRMLTAGRDLSPDDRDALSQRLLHIPVSESASALLASKGGMAYTACPGRRWIEGDAGQPSDFVVAQHFLWLYGKRREYGIAANSPGRFLVEGNATEEILFELRTQAGSSPLVIETLLGMLNSARTDWPGLAVVEDRIFALPSEILSFYRNMPTQGGKSMAVSTVANALKGVARLVSDRPWLLKGREHMGPKRWIEIDPVQLQEVAQHDGWPSGKVEVIIEKQRKAMVALRGMFLGTKEMKGTA